MQKIIVMIVLPLLLISCAISPGIKFLERGQAAYKMQDYHTAFHWLLLAAENDNIQAEYAVGYMYYYGIGTKRDLFAAVKWFQKAARYHDPQAIAALEMIKNSGPPMFDFGKSSKRE